MNTVTVNRPLPDSAFPDFIVSDRLILTPLYAYAPVKTINKWIADPAVTKYTRHKDAPPFDSARDFLIYAHHQWDGYWLITVKDTGRLIGSITTTRNSDRCVDLGIMIGEPSEWGKGYGHDAWAALMQYEREHNRIKSFTAGMHKDNAGMIGICLKAGMTKVLEDETHVFMARDI